MFCADYDSLDCMNFKPLRLVISSIEDSEEGTNTLFAHRILDYA